MATKNQNDKVKIEIKRSVLQALLEMKQVGDSYSMVIERLIKASR
jgi:predicted CopG family antitoxin